MEDISLGSELRPQPSSLLPPPKSAFNAGALSRVWISSSSRRFVFVLTTPCAWPLALLGGAWPLVSSGAAWPLVSSGGAWSLVFSSEACERLSPHQTRPRSASRQPACPPQCPPTLPRQRLPERSSPCPPCSEYPLSSRRQSSGSFLLTTVSGLWRFKAPKATTPS